MRQPESQTTQLTKALNDMREQINFCNSCHNISDAAVCDICSNPNRNPSVICVVEDIRDVLAIEGTASFKGIYHVLGGKISPMDGVGPSDINIKSLVQKVESGVVKVISPIDDTPASNAGIKAGDFIIKIDDTQVQGKSLSEAVDLMRGPVGSSINLTIRRVGQKKALKFNIVREIIEIKSVRAELLKKDIGYIRLTSFNENSSEQISNQIKKFEDNQNVTSYILDLRNNPGGLLSQAIRVSDFFLNNGEIVSTKGRKTSENRRWFAKKGDLIDGKTLLVLINYGSASASEIVAGALKDHKRAIIIGENSYGKGSVQSIIPLKNKGAIRLTVAKYYLPSGKSISEVGVSPDIEINEGSDEFKIKTETDNQLNYALKLLKG